MSPLQTRRLAQEVEDTYRRALIGGAFYLAAWLVVGFYAGTFTRYPAISWSLVLLFLGLAAARIWHRPVRDVDGSTCLIWLWTHWGIVIATTAAWGAVFCWALLDPTFAVARTAALLSTLGLATAIAHSFSMRRGFALASIAMLYLPGLFPLWRDPADRATAVVMMVYLVYVLLSLLRSHVDYQRGLDLDQVLRDQRDLFAEQSRIDSLTDLANRRHFTNVLASATRQSLVTDTPLALLLLDLDHFKSINDTYGHAVGDACLIAVATRLKAAFAGDGELAARLGGEEFGVVLDGHTLSTLALRAERFRENLVVQPISVDGNLLAITVSIGLAEFDRRSHRDDDGLYRAADRAVYRAKSAGRNRVCQDAPVLA